MKDLDDRLTDHLHTQAGRLSMTPAALDRVVARGRQRRRRTRSVTGAVTALAVVAGVAGYQASRPDRSNFTVRVGDAPTSDPSVTTATASSEVDHATPAVTSIDGTAAANTPASVGGGTGTLPQATADGAGLSWKLKNPKSTIGGMYSGVAGGQAALDGRLVALSTAPAGRSTANPNAGYRVDTLYSTADGVEWTPADAPKWLSSLAAGNGRLYAVGTAPADIATSLGIGVGQAIIGSSNDGGKTFTPAALPQPKDAGPRGTRSTPGYGTSMVAGPNGLLVSLTRARQVYLADLVPSGVDASWGVTTSPAGVSVLARPASGRPDAKVCPSGLPKLIPSSDLPSGYGAASAEQAAAMGLAPWVCVAGAGVTDGQFLQLRFDQLGYPSAHTYSWAELGTSWEQLATTTQTEESFLSTDGTTFDPVTLPGSYVNGRLLSADADGFLAVSYRQPDPSVAGSQTMVSYRSTDGRTWTEGTPVPAAWGATSVGRLADGRWAMVGQNNLTGSPVVLTSNDGLAWQLLGLDDVVTAAVGANQQGNVSVADVGPSGITVAVYSMPDLVAERGGVKLSDNGITMTITNVRGATTITDDATGAVLGTASINSGVSSPVLRIDNVPGDKQDVGAIPTTIAGPCASADPCASTVPMVPMVPVYVVIDPATGAERARFTTAALNTAMEAVNADQRPYTPRSTLLTSTDGRSWAVADLSELAGEPITMVAGIDHLGDKVIVRAQTKRSLGTTDPATGMQAFAQVALVGTKR